MKEVFEAKSHRDTFSLGTMLAKKAKSGDVIALTGDLGAGKTVFAKGFAEGLGINEPVSSPTFTILQQYEGGRLPLYHFDVYRIGDVSEMEETGYEDCFFGEGVTLVEWADRIRELMPENTILVQIDRDPEKGFDYRRITVDYTGS